MDKEKIFNDAAQFLLPSLTIGAQIATAMKFPQWGLIINWQLSHSGYIHPGKLTKKPIKPAF